MVIMLTACAPLLRSPLQSVPLLGGDLAQREAAREALLAFDEAVGPGRLELRYVDLDEVQEAPFWGTYFASGISLKPGLSTSTVDGVVRHELCHALDDEEGLSESYLWELEAFAPYVGGEYDAFEKPAEAFARICEGGPPISQLLSVRCEGGPDHGALARLFAEEIWREPYGLPRASGAGEPVTVELDFPIEPLHLSTGSSKVKVWGPRGHTSSTFDAYTGERVDPSTFRYDVPTPALREADLPGLKLRKGAGTPELAAAMAGRTGLWRLLVWEDQQWSLVEGTCLPEDKAQVELFLMDGQMWAAWGEGKSLTWRALSRPR
jgi:hypothetical protein